MIRFMFKYYLKHLNHHKFIIKKYRYTNLNKQWITSTEVRKMCAIWVQNQSFMKIWNNNGPVAEPWGTQKITLLTEYNKKSIWH